MESTLSRPLQDLQAEIGLNLGWGRGALYKDPAWTSIQQGQLDSFVKSGLSQFYYPPPVRGQETSYEWSFLRPVATLTLPIATSSVSLPDDFGGLDGQITLVSSSNTAWYPIDVTHEGKIRSQFSAYPSMTGRPLMAAIVPLKGTGVTQGQRFNLEYFPTTDIAYSVQVAYYVNPDFLTTAFPYAMGGAPHTETILESCLAMAEQRLDDMAGIHTAKFQERLLASINADMKFKAQTLGPNLDHSEARHQRWGRRNHGQGQVSYNGIVY